MKLFFLLIIICFSSAKKLLVFEKLKLLQMDETYGTTKMSAKRYNRTTYLMNVEMNITKPFPDDTLIKLEVYKLSENVYKKTALSYERKFCDYLNPKQKKYFFQTESLRKQVHFMDKCPIKGYFWMKDLDPIALMDCSFFSFLPLWQAKITALIGPKNKPIITSEIYFEVIDIV